MGSPRRSRRRRRSGARTTRVARCVRARAPHRCLARRVRARRALLALATASLPTAPASRSARAARGARGRPGVERRSARDGRLALAAARGHAAVVRRARDGGGRDRGRPRCSARHDRPRGAVAHFGPAWLAGPVGSLAPGSPSCACPAPPSGPTRARSSGPRSAPARSSRASAGSSWTARPSRSLIARARRPSLGSPRCASADFVGLLTYGAPPPADGGDRPERDAPDEPAPAATPRSLLIHDGELADVRALLVSLKIQFVERLGAESTEDRELPLGPRDRVREADPRPPAPARLVAARPRSRSSRTTPARCAARCAAPARR